MSKTINQLERLIHLYSPAQVAVWLNYSDPRPILAWIRRGNIPPSKLAKVEALIAQKGVKLERIIRRTNGKKETTS